MPSPHVCGTEWIEVTSGSSLYSPHVVSIVCIKPGHFFFFFSSRRRHTRCSRDWSSDVCSSDLAKLLADWFAHGQHKTERQRHKSHDDGQRMAKSSNDGVHRSDCANFTTCSKFSDYPSRFVKL